MTSVFDALNAENPSSNTQIFPALAAGVDVLSGSQEVTFWPYIRTILPVDGYVFWLRSDLLQLTQLATHGITSSNPVVASGSLHYASVGSQMEDETIVIRSVDFTSERPIEAFGAIAPDVMYVGSWDTMLGSFQFAFSRRSSFYQQAGQWHLVGDAIYPAFAAQLIDDISSFDQRQIVSNSMPLWFSMMINVVPGLWVRPPNIQLYPAFLVPDNLLPAYGVVSIPPEGTRHLAAAPSWDRRMSAAQLTVDRVSVILYGLRNDEAWDFKDYVIQYATTTGQFGVMNTPTIRDDRRRQTEAAALAQKKYIDFEVCYLQHRARDLARGLIQQAVLGAFKTVPIVI